MPGRDGKGPVGLGNYVGKMAGGSGLGSDGYCECPKCGTKIKHTRGVPCVTTKCPKCGSAMTRN